MEIADLPLVGGHPALDLVNTVERGRTAPGGRPGPSDRPAGLAALGAAGGPGRRRRGGGGGRSWGRTRVRRRRPGSGPGRPRGPPHGPAGGHGHRPGRPWGGRCRPGAAAWAVGGGGRALAAGARARGEVGGPAGRRGDAGPSSFPTGPPTSPWTCSAGPTWPACGAAPPEAGGCGWLFLDQSRNGSRRWCRMADCGSTAKARRLTERRRAARGLVGLPAKSWTEGA